MEEALLHKHEDQEDLLSFNFCFLRRTVERRSCVRTHMRIKHIIPMRFHQVHRPYVGIRIEVNRSDIISKSDIDESGRAEVVCIRAGRRLCAYELGSRLSHGLLL